VQRQGAALAIRKIDYIPDPENEGWYLAAWGEDIMKAGVAHILPIPPRVVQHMAEKFELVKREDSHWLLPSERGEDDIHVHRSSTLAVVQRLGARDTLTRKRATAVDLLAANGIKWWTPHDLRRTITKVLDDAGIPGGASVVLAHEVRRTDKLDTENDDSREQRVARITRLAYGGAQHLHLKRKAMSIWTDAVLDEYVRLKYDWEPAEQ
jgi:integrase